VQTLVSNSSLLRLCEGKRRGEGGAVDQGEQEGVKGRLGVVVCYRFKSSLELFWRGRRRALWRLGFRVFSKNIG
jgi:hypothetical protein